MKRNECRERSRRFAAPTLAILMALSTRASALPDTVDVSSDLPLGEGSLNRAVEAATAAKNLSSTVFRLEPNGYYVLTDSILVPAGEHLTIIAPEPGTAQETAPPQIVLSSSFGNPTLKGSSIIDCYGDLTLKNVWVLYADTGGRQMYVSIFFHDDPSNVDGRRCEFNNVIIDYAPLGASAGGSVTVACKRFRGIFRNSYWKNCTDTHWRYYGRALSFPYASTGWYGDSVLFDNCTFANIGYVLMQEGGEFHNDVKFNHCTFLNVVMFSLESGWWNKLSVTNCIFVNAHMFGQVPALTGTDEPYGATLRIDSLSREYSSGAYAFPFTEQERRVLFANSSHYLEDWIRDWMWNSPHSVYMRGQGLYDEVPVPQPMLSPGTLRFFDSTDSQGYKVFPHFKRTNLYDSTDPGFLLPPSDTGAIKSFLQRRWNDSSDTSWAWRPLNSIGRLWPLEENLAYANSTLKTAGIGGFPLGDLSRWWPEKYQEWKAQETAENDTIDKWLHFGFTPVTTAEESPGIPGRFELEQNYPNPFNPTTHIRYSTSRKGYVSLRIYDILGHQVATLFEGIQVAGNHTTAFDGSGLPGGVYFYRLYARPIDGGQADTFVQTKKLILLK